MANKAYSLENLHLQMREERLCAGLSQEQMGALLKKGRKAVSEIENGYVKPNPLLAIRWFEITESYEHIDLVHYLFNLHPLATVPVDPELNQRPAMATNNLRRQIEHALPAIERIEEWMLKQRPGRKTEIPLGDFKELSDLDDALKTLFYACQRKVGLDMKEVSDSWTMEALADQVAMPRYQEKTKEMSFA
ncbi:hypothetical protein CHH91_04410 [Virgibacillus sp. 7505]|uniref:helix-turn-helix domain-containing protein n=1 Tax=Virgibacillus sp. 7505 TaxID=2022548 RepID=UPI000BA53627|nr:helix-turn-helix transcriptional regulator [Virgibacillus sp. 7505]PAE17256.1 hypothetical protein CHH91_04410 [Virgibacillus sp. 7505]